MNPLAVLSKLPAVNSPAPVVVFVGRFAAAKIDVPLMFTSRVLVPDVAASVRAETPTMRPWKGAVHSLLFVPVVIAAEE